jgi:hypothetical protein
MACRTAAASQDLDLRKGDLILRPYGPVSHDHELDGNQWKEGVAD